MSRSKNHAGQIKRRVSVEAMFAPRNLPGQEMYEYRDRTSEERADAR
jgi:hypothetical protein